jgi:hypothetical protein
MNNINIDNCTRCGTKFKDFRIYITLSTKVERITELSTWEEIQNLTNDVSEVLCSECFDKFVALQNQMNIPNNNTDPEENKFVPEVEVDYDVKYADEN